MAYNYDDDAPTNQYPASDPGQCRHGWRSDQCPYRYDNSAPMGACGGSKAAESTDSERTFSDDDLDREVARVNAARAGTPLPLLLLRYHVSGAVARGEAEPIIEVRP